MISRWTDKELRQANKEDLYISVPNEDGSMHAPTWIWMVEAGGELYCRSYNGPDGRWYTAAKRAGHGKAKFGSVERAVNFDFTVDEVTNKAIDAAYQTKYAGSPYLDGPLSEPMRSATVRLVPVEESRQ